MNTSTKIILSTAFLTLSMIHSGTAYGFGGSPEEIKEFRAKYKAWNNVEKQTFWSALDKKLHLSMSTLNSRAPYAVDSITEYSYGYYSAETSTVHYKMDINIDGLIVEIGGDSTPEEGRQLLKEPESIDFIYQSTASGICTTPATKFQVDVLGINFNYKYYDLETNEFLMEIKLDSCINYTGEK